METRVSRKAREQVKKDSRTDIQNVTNALPILQLKSLRSPQHRNLDGVFQLNCKETALMGTAVNEDRDFKTSRISFTVKIKIFLI
jgi:hypothetical protein